METLEGLKKDMAEAIEEALGSLDNSDLGMAFRDGFSDEIHEQADGLVPIYTQDLIDCAAETTWLLTEAPEIDANNGLDCIRFNIYAELYLAGYEAVVAFKDNDEDEAERFGDFLETSRRNGVEFDDCEEAYFQFESSRDTTATEVYEECFKEFKEAKGGVI